MNVEEAKSAIYSVMSRSSPINYDNEKKDFIEYLYRVGFEISFEKKRKRERPLFFSKRLAISRMFNSWFNKNPEFSKYGMDMLLISYLDKKGWLNTQKIMNQMTDSRIKAILGEGVADKLIGDEKSKDNIGVIKERLDKIRKKYNIKNKGNGDEV